MISDSSCFSLSSYPVSSHVLLSVEISSSPWRCTNSRHRSHGLSTASVQLWWKNAAFLTSCTVLLKRLVRLGNESGWHEAVDFLFIFFFYETLLFFWMPWCRWGDMVMDWSCNNNNKNAAEILPVISLLLSVHLGLLDIFTSFLREHPFSNTRDSIV